MNKNYPIYKTTFIDDIRSLVEEAAQNFANDIAISYKDKPSGKEVKKVTFAQWRDDVRHLGTALIAHGLREENIAIVGENSYGWCCAFFAVMGTGSVTVPVDKELPIEDIDGIITTTGCKAVIYGRTAEGKVKELLAKGGLASAKLLVAIDPAPAIDKALLGDKALTTVAALETQGEERYKGGDNAYYDYKIDVNKLASIVFTSGTTGKGKGVMLSQKNICSDMEQGIYNFQITERTLVVLPPHHTFGSTINIAGHFALGCELYISSGIKYIMKELQEFRPTHLILVPLFVETFYKRIMSTAEKTGKLPMLKKLIKTSNALLKTGIDLRKTLFKSVTKNFGGEIEMIICGGAALNQNIIDFFEGIGITILNGYGITECAPLISCNRNEYRKQGSVGLPIVGGEVKIIDPDENGEGEIAYRGPNVMLGYYKDEEATRAVIDEDGFFHTGDYGKVELEGDDQWIYITGRLKNLIIFSNGKNVYPEEIETDIQGVYGVNEVVVYAGESKSDPSKEVIVAEIYPDCDGLKSHGIEDAKAYFTEEIKKINQKNVSYKTVGLVKIRETEFPKNTSRKITRFAIDKSID